MYRERGYREVDSSLQSDSGFTSVGVVLLLLAALGGVLWWSGFRPNARQPPAIIVSAEQLYQEYNGNEVSADGRYKNRTILVDGTVQKIGKDILDSAYVVIGGRGFLDGVQCIFPHGDTTLSEISIGEHIWVRGSVTGKMGNVLLDDCSLENEPVTPIESVPQSRKEQFHFATVSEAQAEALRRYPELGKAGSKLNTEFVARYKLYQQQRPEYFQDVSWPMLLAQELTQPSQSGLASPLTTPTQPNKAGEWMWKRRGNPLDASPRR